MAARRTRTRFLALLAACWAVVPHAWAQENPTGEFKPFAEKHLVLQLSDQADEAVVLNVANNLIKHYGGPDLIDIEIVTFGPGIRLLYANNEHEARIKSLVDNGVRFYVCDNTIQTIEREGKARLEINPLSLHVQAGVAHVLDRVEQGYTLVRP